MENMMEVGELADSAIALDWLQNQNQIHKNTGFVEFLLVHGWNAIITRRPEILKSV